MGYPKDIGGKECTILYSGPGEAFESLKDVLLSLGGNPIFVGEDIGNASTLDSSILSFFYGSMLAFFHGAAICESEGFSIQEYTSTLISLLPVVGDTMKTSADMITKGNYEGSQASLSIHTAAAGHILHLSQESGIDSAYPQLLRSYFERALAAGHDAHELAALFEEIRKPRGGA